MFDKCVAGFRMTCWTPAKVSPIVDIFCKKESVSVRVQVMVEAIMRLAMQNSFLSLI